MMQRLISGTRSHGTAAAPHSCASSFKVYWRNYELALVGERIFQTVWRFAYYHSKFRGGFQMKLILHILIVLIAFKFQSCKSPLLYTMVKKNQTKCEIAAFKFKPNDRLTLNGVYANDKITYSENWGRTRVTDMYGDSTRNFLLKRLSKIGFLFDTTRVVKFNRDRRESFAENILENCNQTFKDKNGIFLFVENNIMISEIISITLSDPINIQTEYVFVRIANEKIVEITNIEIRRTGQHFRKYPTYKDIKKVLKRL